jgi:hypothetical protein
VLQPPRLLTAARVTADRQWSELRNANAEVASVVKRLHDLYGAHPEVYADGVRTAVASSAKRVRFFGFLMPDLAGVLIPGPSGCPTAPRSFSFLEVCMRRRRCVTCNRHTAFYRILNSIPFGPQRVRKGMKGMGESVGVPIEPDEQTRLLDACIQRAGVIGGGVPGGKSRSRLPVISKQLRRSDS